jgi:hypothetical protein
MLGMFIREQCRAKANTMTTEFSIGLDRLQSARYGYFCGLCDGKKDSGEAERIDW